MKSATLLFWTAAVGAGLALQQLPSPSMPRLLSGANDPLAVPPIHALPRAHQKSYTVTDKLAITNWRPQMPRTRIEVQDKDTIRLIGDITKVGYQIMSKELALGGERRYVVHAGATVTTGHLGIGVLDATSGQWVAQKTIEAKSEFLEFTTPESGRVQVVLYSANHWEQATEATISSVWIGKLAAAD